MKKTTIRMVSAALVCAMALSVAACGKKKNGNGAGPEEESHSGQKISADSPWFECTKTEITPAYNPNKQVQSTYSTLVGCDENYLVVLTNGTSPSSSA